MRTILIGLLLLMNIPSATAEGQTNEAAKRLELALAGSGEQAIALQELADKNYIALGARLRRVAAVSGPNQAEAVALQGSVAFLAGRMRDAVAYFQKAEALAPLKDVDAFTMAMALVSLGDHQRAADTLADLHKRNPNQFLYVYWLGRLDYDLRLYPEAVAKFQKALELNPKSPRAWDSLGLAFDMQGEVESAHQALLKAASLNRESLHPSAWPPHDLGYWFLRMNQPKDAEDALSESLRYDPKLAQAHYHLARAMEQNGRLEQAIAEYNEAIAEDPSAQDACYSLGMLYRKSHREKEAAAMFTEYRRRKAVQAQRSETEEAR